MAEEYTEITEEQLDDIARYAIKTGLDPRNKRLVKHISKCDCDNCRPAKTMLDLFGPRIMTILTLQEAPAIKH